MHFDHTDIFNVVEGIGLVTAKTLINTGLLLSSNGPIHHFKMHHVMARRWLVTLGTFRRSGARVEKAANLPACVHMAAGTLLTEEPLMLVLRGVTGLAIKRRRMACGLLRDRLQYRVIHQDGTLISPLMLDVTSSALRHARMERRGRLHQ